MNPDLVHPAGEGPAEHHARLPVEVHALELGAALLAARRDFAHANLVADHLHRLAALCLALGEFSFHPTDIFFQHLPKNFR